MVCSVPSTAPTVAQSVGLFMGDSLPTACGGDDEPTSCFSYRADDDVWALSPSLNVARSGAAAARMANGTWIVTGGRNAENEHGTDSTEVKQA